MHVRGLPGDRWCAGRYEGDPQVSAWVQQPRLCPPPVSDTPCLRVTAMPPQRPLSAALEAWSLPSASNLVLAVITTIE